MPDATVAKHNQQLKQLISEIDVRTAQARHKQELVALVDKVIAFRRPLRYNYSGFIKWNLLALIGAVLLFAAQQSQLLPVTWSPWWWLSLPVFAAIITLSTFMARRLKIAALADALFFKKLLFDNQLTPATYQPKQKAIELAVRFFDFNQGNHLREIDTLYDGRYQGNQHSFDYQYYRFHYVNRRTVTETYTDSKGKTRIRTRTVYDHFYRYGLLLEFADLRNHRLCLSGHHSGKLAEHYKPASNQFNRHFTLTADNALAAAKFCKPRVVETCNQLANLLDKCSLEIDVTGMACLSFHSAHLLNATRTHGFDQPVAFKREVVQHTTLSELQKVLALLETLQVHSDNNF